MSIIITYSLILILITLNLLSLFGYVTFGMGLGDLGYFIVFIAFIICSILLLIFTKCKKEINILVSIFMVLAIGFFLIKTTVGRGSEYPWNGHFFINVEGVDNINKENNVIEKVEDF